ncbi:hypothetical protein ACWED2_15380 [Amycolatopsis sp. NPDC005003]
MSDRTAFRAFARRHRPDVGGDPAVFAAGLARFREPDTRFDAPVTFVARRRRVAAVPFRRRRVARSGRVAASRGAAAVPARLRAALFPSRRVAAPVPRRRAALFPSRGVAAAVPTRRQAALFPRRVATPVPRRRVAALLTRFRRPSRVR